MRTREVEAVLAALRGDLARLSDLDLAGLPAGGLLAAARELQQLLNALDAQVTRVLGVVHSRGAAFEDGFGSTQAWALSELFAPAGQWRGGTLASGIPVRPETARRLACDATIIPMVLGVASEPLDVGRATRWPPPALRRAVISRDGRCRFPGCDRPLQWTDLHHL